MSLKTLLTQNPKQWLNANVQDLDVGGDLTVEGNFVLNGDLTATNVTATNKAEGDIVNAVSQLQLAGSLFYETQVLPLNFSFIGVNHILNLVFTRVGKIVTMYVPRFVNLATGAIVAPGFTTPSLAIPAQFRPFEDVAFPIILFNSAAPSTAPTVQGKITVSSSTAIINILNGLDTTAPAMTPTSVYSMDAFSVTWSTA